MFWYLWLIVGVFTGIMFTILFVATFAYTVMHKPALQQKYMSALMRSAMTRSKRRRTNENSGGSVG